jgi:hypothetical protein
MSDLLANEPVRPARTHARRIVRRAPNRLPNVDMRTRQGKLYRHAFETALEQFPGAPAEQIAQIARLRLLAEQEKIAALSGRGSATVAARISNVAIRAAAALTAAAKSKPTDGRNALAEYLASRQDADVELEADAEESAQ